MSASSPNSADSDLTADKGHVSPPFVWPIAEMADELAELAQRQRPDSPTPTESGYDLVSNVGGQNDEDGTEIGTDPVAATLQHDKTSEHQQHPITIGRPPEKKKCLAALQVERKDKLPTDCRNLLYEFFETEAEPLSASGDEHCNPTVGHMMQTLLPKHFTMSMKQLTEMFDRQLQLLHTEFGEFFDIAPGEWCAERVKDRGKYKVLLHPKLDNNSASRNAGARKNVRWADDDVPLRGQQNANKEGGRRLNDLSMSEQDGERFIVESDREADRELRKEKIKGFKELLSLYNNRKKLIDTVNASNSIWPKVIKAEDVTKCFEELCKLPIFEPSIKQMYEVQQKTREDNAKEYKEAEAGTGFMPKPRRNEMPGNRGEQYLNDLEQQSLLNSYAKKQRENELLMEQQRIEQQKQWQQQQQYYAQLHSSNANPRHCKDTSSVKSKISEHQQHPITIGRPTRKKKCLALLQVEQKDKLTVCLKYEFFMNETEQFFASGDEHCKPTVSHMMQTLLLKHFAMSMEELTEKFDLQLKFLDIEFEPPEFIDIDPREWCAERVKDGVMYKVLLHPKLDNNSSSRIVDARKNVPEMERQ
uniref:Uncharacterized protein n=1 Tax=Globodera rostochiensis TaxID=31243 RepID=A0A914HDU9_GLORO